MRGESSITCQVNGFEQKSICRTKERTYVISAPDIFKNSNHRNFFSRPEFFYRLPSQFLHTKLSHSRKDATVYGFGFRVSGSDFGLFTLRLKFRTGYQP